MYEDDCLSFMIDLFDFDYAFLIQSIHQVRSLIDIPFG